MQRQKIVPILVILGVTLATYLLLGHFHTQKLFVHVGESMKDVLTRNERANFNPDVMYDNVPIVWPENDLIPQTFDMTYDGPEGAIRFPHARLVWATQYAGVVTDILVGVSEKKETLPAFVAEAQQVAVSFQKAGWTQQGNLPTVESLRSGVAGVKTDAVEGGLLAFRKGSITAVLQIQGFSAESGKSSQESASYTLGVQFADAALHDAQQKKTYFEHLRVKGSVDETLPLSYWINQPR